MSTVVWTMIVLILTSPVFFILWIVSRKKLVKAQQEFTNMSVTQRESFDTEVKRLIDENTKPRMRLEPILSVEAEAASMRAELALLGTQIETIRATYKEKRTLLDKLSEQVAVYDERLAFAELGVYEPHFDFTDSEGYKREIDDCRREQKMMVFAKTAVSANNNWTVDGSKAKGQTMINRQIRLTMRAFNNEAEAAIANVRWNNVNAMEKRVHAAVKSINDSNASMQIELNPAYTALKIKEIRLTHEYRERLKAEKDERAEAARLSREEAKLLRDAEVAERAEEKYQTLLDKARREAEAAVGNETLSEKVALLEAELAAAHAATERARAMAEMTRTGYVYIISNIGSFGEDVVKIGLTRPLAGQFFEVPQRSRH
ncbi:MAG: DUF4041 domain-containing protein [Polyangiaceae bacterium]